MEDLINEDAILAVKKGINWLDENHPGWVTRIDLNSLDMSECKDCVIGQAVGDYCKVIEGQAGGFGPSIIWAVEHGFEWPGVMGYQSLATTPIPASYDYFTLDALWACEVKKRFG